MTIPEGWARTGEWRVPEDGEWFLCFIRGEWVATQGIHERTERPILVRAEDTTNQNREAVSRPSTKTSARASVSSMGEER